MIWPRDPHTSTHDNTTFFKVVKYVHLHIIETLNYVCDIIYKPQCQFSLQSDTD